MELLERIEPLADADEQDRPARDGAHARAQRRLVRRRRAWSSTTPSKSTASWNCSATTTASWPVMLSSTSRVCCGETLRRIFTSSSISSRSTCRRPAVSTRTTSRPCWVADSTPQRAISTGSAFGAALEDGDADLLAERAQLVDRGRAVDVAARRGPASVPATAGASRACPRRSSCRSPAGRTGGSRSAASRRTSASRWCRRAAPSAPRRRS